MRVGHCLRNTFAAGFWQAPNMVAVFTISLMSDEAKDNAQVQKPGWQQELPRHLRIADAQGAAFRAVNRLLTTDFFIGVQAVGAVTWINLGLVTRGR